MSAYYPTNIPTSYHTITQAPADLSVYGDLDDYYDPTNPSGGAPGISSVFLPLPTNHPQNYIVQNQNSTPSPSNSPPTAGKIPDPHPQYRPSTKDAVKNAKLKVHVFLDSTLYVAGGTLYGRMELNCSTAKSIRIGEVAVELTGYEELTTATTARSTSFLSSRIVFQSPTDKSIPPSNAVIGPQRDGFWLARKGKTTFPFVFRLPPDVPSSASWKEGGGEAAVRFIVTGVIQIQTSPFTSATEDTLFRSKSANIVELFDPYNFPPVLAEVRHNARRLWMGGSGELVIEARVAGGEDGAVCISGGTVAVAVRVQNGTKRRVQGVRAVVSQRLIYNVNEELQKRPRAPDSLLYDEDDLVKISQVISEKRFFEKDFLFDIGEERVMSLVLDVPQRIRTIRNTSLFEIECVLTIGIVTGMFSKDLSVELPLTILHPASISSTTASETITTRTDSSYMDTITTVRTTTPITSISTSSAIEVPIGHGASSSAASYDSDEGQGLFRGHHSPTASSVGSLLSRSASSIRSFLSGSPSPSLKDFKLDSYGSEERINKQNSRNGVANPVTYVPAVERARYLSFGTGRAADFKSGIAAMRREASGGSALSGISNNGVRTPRREGSDISALSRGTGTFSFRDRAGTPTLGADLARANSVAATSLVDPMLQQDRMYDFSYSNIEISQPPPHSLPQLPRKIPDPTAVDSLYEIAEPMLMTGASPKPLPALPLPVVIDQYNSMNHHWEEEEEEENRNSKAITRESILIDEDAVLGSLQPRGERSLDLSTFEDVMPREDYEYYEEQEEFEPQEEPIQEADELQEDEETRSPSPHSPYGMPAAPPRKSVPAVPHFYIRRDLTPLMEESESELGSRPGTVKSSIVGTLRSFAGEDLEEYDEWMQEDQIGEDADEEWKPDDFGDVARVFGIVELSGGSFEEKFENISPREKPTVVDIPVEAATHINEMSDDTEATTVQDIVAGNGNNGVVGKLWKLVGSWTGETGAPSTESNAIPKREPTNLKGPRPTRIITDFTPPSTMKSSAPGANLGPESALSRAGSSSGIANGGRVNRKPVHDIPHSPDFRNVDTPTQLDASDPPAQPPSSSYRPSQTAGPSSSAVQHTSATAEIPPLPASTSKSPALMSIPASTYLSYAVVQANTDPGTLKSAKQPAYNTNATGAIATSFVTRKPVPGSGSDSAPSATPANAQSASVPPGARPASPTKKVSPGLKEYMKKYAAAVGVEEWGKRFEE